MKTLDIDRDRCEGHGLCAQLAPEVFQLDDDGELHLVVGAEAEVSEQRLAAAVRSCPVAALRLG